MWANSPLWSLLLLSPRPNPGLHWKDTIGWSWQWCKGHPWISSVVNFGPFLLGSPRAGYSLGPHLEASLLHAFMFSFTWPPYCPHILQELCFLVRTSSYRISFLSNCCCLPRWSQLRESIIKSPSAAYPAWWMFYLFSLYFGIFARGSQPVAFCPTCLSTDFLVLLRYIFICLTLGWLISVLLLCWYLLFVNWFCNPLGEINSGLIMLEQISCRLFHSYIDLIVIEKVKWLVKLLQIKSMQKS